MTTEIPPSSLARRIAEAGAELTPTERRIAEAVTSNPSLVAFGTVTDVAKAAATSRPSVVRFAVKIGFSGFTELQESVQQAVTRSVFSPSERVRHEGEHPTEDARSGLISAVTSTCTTVGDDALNELGDRVATARRVWVVSGETSQAGAIVLVSGLSIVRTGVTFVDHHTQATDLAEATPGDVVVVFDFYRYRTAATDTTRAFAGMGVPIVAVTDGPLSPAAALADSWVGLDVPAIGPFDSSVPAVAAAELMVAHVTRRLGAEARTRIDTTEATWRATHTFLPDE